MFKSSRDPTSSFKKKHTAYTLTTYKTVPLPLERDWTECKSLESISSAVEKIERKIAAVDDVALKMSCRQVVIIKSKN